ncbi:MAG: DUF3320 domain-containing protein [Cohaesibacter sp.]|nr:DUF3320 domain-containing protein [Cohaesibacter sp.]
MSDLTSPENTSSDIAAFEISIEMASRANYASWQNSVPLISSLELRNNDEKNTDDLTLSLSFVPAFAQTTSWKIDRIPSKDTISLSNLDIVLDADYLNTLDEAEKGMAHFTLQDGNGRKLMETRHELQLLARDEWGGFEEMAGIAAAFVMPNDPAIAQILRDAGEILSQYGHIPSLDGYQSGDPKRVYMLGAAIWSAVAGMGLLYAEPPKSFELQGQKVRRPSTIKEQGLATCFDSSLLFAAALEAVGLNPVLLLTKGHSYCGFWLKETTLSTLIETDPIEIRKALAARELVTFETTGVTSRPADQFDKALTIGRSYTSEENSPNFIGAIDIARARASQIRPMASHQPLNHTDHSFEDPSFEVTALPLPQVPNFEDLPIDDREEAPNNPKDRIARWQNKLLDLSLRNRLLNFKTSKQTVPFLCSDVPFLEDQLAARKRFRLISLPEENPHGNRDEDLHRRKTGRDLDQEFAAQSLQRNELPSMLEKDDMNKRLIELFRRAKNDLNEGGSNTLFLAVGFLRWKRSETDEKSYKAPLLLLPVKLTRKSAASRFHLEHHEDEVRFNATLMELLKKDFDLSLPSFDVRLPTDESGIDVPYVFEAIRRAVRDVPGFEVLNETALSTFSFAKYLMWKDLVDRTDDLRKNRVVRHLIDNPDKVFESGTCTAFPSEKDMDVKYQPKDIVTPLPADSSQLSAVMASVEGHDFILVGPPGTGKSQTITNMIAQCLANGKSVLFVAEKTAALDVVYRRLRENGLGDFCLELHSNKAERKQFLAQLKASWEQGKRAGADEWIDLNSRLKVHRDHLNDYITALHQAFPCGWSIFDALGLAVRNADNYAPRLDWDRTQQPSAETLAQRRQTISDLASVHKQLTPIEALKLVRTRDWSNRWQSQLLESAHALSKAIASLIPQVQYFVRTLNLRSAQELSLADLDQVFWLAKLLISTTQNPLYVVFESRLNQIKQSVEQLETNLKLFHSAETNLHADYDQDNVLRLPIDEIDRHWREACTKMWPFSVFAKGKVRKLLQTYTKGGNANPELEISHLRDMQAALTSLNAQQDKRFYPSWEGTKTDPEKLKAYFYLAENIKASFEQIGHLSEASLLGNTDLQSCLSKGESDHPLRQQADKLIAMMNEFQRRHENFCTLAEIGRDEFDEAGFLPNLQKTLGELTDSATKLQVWTEWQKVKAKANNQQLACFVDAIEDGLIPHDKLMDRFNVSFANWWLPDAIDRSPTLRRFKRFKHEEMLEEFKELDDKARAAAARHVQRKLNHGLPVPQGVPKKSELGQLRHQMELKRPSKSIRDVISAMPDSFNKLAPCLLMSPLSISQYLPAGQSQFDVVIFDEASQITTWDAVGAIARGKQAIIVGDPKQLPPTNFFGRTEEDDDDDLEIYEKDLESILEEAKASGLPTLQLNWHYRSRHESLIAFSNWHYYNNRLITFPSPVVTDQAVSLVHTPDAIYDRGKSRTNKMEAQAIVKKAVERLTEWLKLPEDSRLTLGIITFNQQQQTLIQDLFDAELRNNPELEWFFSDERIEPVIVRNLENVQGDERDVMLFSITFAPDLAGKMSMSFGAINKDGGERRLNVAITRAREELLIFSAITADVIDVSRSKALGVKHLKEFLAFAEKGPSSLAASIEGSVGDYDSPFEEAVAEALSSRGWTIVPQVGVSSFRVDLGVIHPDKPGAFLAGIECDGATYHSSATARDRDKVREQVLQNLGWKILRIWSPDWWYDATRVADDIDQKLSELVAISREEDKRKQQEAALRAEEEAIAEQERKNREQKQELEKLEEQEQAQQTVNAGSAVSTSPAKLTSHFASNSTNETQQTKLYVWTNFADFQPDPDRFHHASYADTLAQMIEKVVQEEGPIKDTSLAQRITKAHGWSRTGNLLKKEIDKHLTHYEETIEATGRFIWLKGTRAEIICFRPALDPDFRRSINDIPLAEIAGLLRDNPGLIEVDEPVYALAHAMGYNRVAKAIKSRLEEAIRYYQSYLEPA